ncbi:LysM peptidoglycan-binding domain-containing protein [Hymenobacter algoricola]|uniref:LysM domain-containing protein n=1 Tax=Hymenobacter algoricola TaxID=486267 RepID=A0ABP7MY38_9BACT
MTSFFRLIAGAAVLFSALSATPAPPDKITTEQLLTRLTASISSLKTLRCSVRAQERSAGKYQQARTAMKMTYNPLRVYLRNDKGIEVLWVTGQNDGDAWVYPNSFPYVTLSLDPNGAIMRRNQHHSALDAGFGTIADIIKGSTQRQDHTFERTFRYAGDTTITGRPCHILRSDFPQFRYVTYKTTKAETVASIADRFGCGEFRIVERNDLSIDVPVPAGKTLQVPNGYGRRTIVCVDQKLLLPLVVQVHDDKGLFEKFEFSDVVPNQPIAAAEFAKGYKGYKL